MVSDSQSTCGAQRRRVKFFWRVVVVLACAVVGFFVFSFYALLHDDGLPSMDGRLPLEKRVSIEAFQRDVEPHILSARQALFEDTGGVRPYSEGSRISTAVGESWTLYSQNTDGAKVSVDAVYEVMRDYVEPQGYVLALDSMSKDGRHVFVWRDYDNGGTVDVNINGDWTSFAYESGARPSDGSVPDPRVLIPNDSRDIAGYVSDSLPSVRYLDGDAPEFPETDGSEWAEKRQLRYFSVMLNRGFCVSETKLLVIHRITWLVAAPARLKGGAALSLQSIGLRLRVSVFSVVRVMWGGLLRWGMLI